MKKIFTLIAGVMLAASASATTPYKALYVTAEACPAGSGVVYLDVKEGDKAYVKAQSEDYDETAFLKYVGGENGGGDEAAAGSFGGNIGTYEAIVYAEPESDYEFVCLAGVLKTEENAVYTAADCFLPMTGEGQTDRVYDFGFYANIADGNMINVNNTAHAEDGNSGDGPSRDEIFADDSYWTGDVDTKVYVIFREKGAEYPKFDGEASGVNSVLAPVDNDAAYTISGVRANESTKGIVVVNGKKFINK